MLHINNAKVNKLFFCQMKAVALFLTLTRHALATPALVDCPVDDFCAYPCADELAGIDEAMRARSIDIGFGVKMGSPHKLDYKLRGGSYIYSSLSHEGIFAVSSLVGERKAVQLTNMLSGNQCEFNVEGTTNIGFYDSNMLVLTYRKPIRRCSVSSMFEKPDISTLERVGEIDKVSCYTDVSLLHTRRVLYYTSSGCLPYKYNIDTGQNKRVLDGKKVWPFGSVTGINTNTKTIFREYGNGNHVFGLKKDGKLSEILSNDPIYCLTFILPSSSDPTDLRKALKIYSNGRAYIKENECVSLDIPIKFEGGLSIVRIYRDIFLMFDDNSESWVLTRIVVP